MNNFTKIIKDYISDLVQLSINNIIIKKIAQKCLLIFQYLFDNFVLEMELYYQMLIPFFVSF